MTTVTEISAKLEIDPKRARRILRKAGSLKHEKGGSWRLTASQAKKAKAILEKAVAAAV